MLGLVELARDARTVALRQLPDSSFSDPEIVVDAVAAAAKNGRVAVLEIFAQRGAAIDRTLLSDMAIRSDAPETLAWLDGDESAVVTHAEIQNAIAADSAQVLRYWMAAGRVGDPIQAARVAVLCESVCCLRALARDPRVRDIVARFVAARGSRKLDGLFPIEGSPALALPALADRRGSLSAAPRRYTYLTPSAEIDVNAVSLRFLIYRRIMRLLFVRRIG